MGGNSDYAAVGMVLAGLAGLIYLVKEGKELFFPDRSRDEQFVKRADVDEMCKRLEMALIEEHRRTDSLIAELRARDERFVSDLAQHIHRREFDDLRQFLTGQIDKLDKYAHDNVHRLTNLVSETKLSIVESQVEIGAKITSLMSKVLSTLSTRGGRGEEHDNAS